MTVASGARTRLVYVEESTRGVTPGSPAMKVLRSTGRAVNPVIETLRSDELAANRQVKSVRHGFASVSGTIPFEVSLQSYDDWLAFLLGGTWTAVTTSGSPDIAVDASASTFTRSVGSWISDGYRVGDIVAATGFTNSANNAQWRVTALTATVMTVYDPDNVLVTESGAVGEEITLVGKRLDIGTTLKTITLERQLLDVGKYQPFKGVAVNSMSLSVQPRQVAGGSFGIIGMDPLTPMSGTPLDATPDAAPTTHPVTAFDGRLFTGGTLLAVATGVNYNVENNRTVDAVIGSQISPDVFEGECVVSGDLSAMFEDETYVNQFLAETTFALWQRLDDPDGTNWLNLVVPRAKFTGNTIDPPRTGAVVQAMPWAAEEDPTTGQSFWIQRSNA